MRFGVQMFKNVLLVISKAINLITTASSKFNKNTSKHERKKVDGYLQYKNNATRHGEKNLL